MVQKIEWTLRARSDLRKIHDYISVDSFRYAQVQIENIQTAVLRLIQYPFIGRVVPEFPHLPYRELIVDSYRVLYRHDENRNCVLIMAVVHGRRDLNDPPL